MKSIYAATALLAGTFIAYAAPAKDPELLSLDAVHFTQTATVFEEAHATRISTEHGYIERAGLMGEVWHDEFISALIDHDPRGVSYQVDVSITYRGAPRAYQTAEFRGVEQTETVPVKVVKRQAINCPTGECTYTEHLAIPVDEALLRHIAQGYATGKPELWHFRVLAKGSGDYRGALSNAEVAGLLAKVDAYLENPAPAAAPLPAPAPARLDFGISGLTVGAASEAQAGAPERAGVLVAAVSRGSIAHDGGIITGDIIYQFDGHPIHSPADLQTAVLATKPGTIAHIKLYRGLERTSLEAQF
jgi:hypothetical protein